MYTYRERGGCKATSCAPVETTHLYTINPVLRLSAPQVYLQHLIGGPCVTMEMLQFQ